MGTAIDWFGLGDADLGADATSSSEADVAPTSTRAHFEKAPRGRGPVPH